MWVLLKAAILTVCVVAENGDNTDNTDNADNAKHDENKIERTASLVVLPPLVLGYEDLYEQPPEEIPEPAKQSPENTENKNNQQIDYSDTQKPGDGDTQKRDIGETQKKDVGDTQKNDNEDIQRIGKRDSQKIDIDLQKLEDVEKSDQNENPGEIAREGISDDFVLPERLVEDCPYGGHRKK